MSNTDNILSMLEAVHAERAKLKERDSALALREEVLVSWLAEERAAPQQNSLLVEEESSLNQFILAALAGGKELSAAKLGDMAQEKGLISRNAFPGRVVHGALLGMQKRNLVRRNSELRTWSKS